MQTLLFILMRADIKQICFDGAINKISCEIKKHYSQHGNDYRPRPPIVSLIDESYGKKNTFILTAAVPRSAKTALCLSQYLQIWTTLSYARASRGTRITGEQQGNPACAALSWARLTCSLGSAQAQGAPSSTIKSVTSLNLLHCTSTACRGGLTHKHFLALFLVYSICPTLPLF